MSDAKTAISDEQIDAISRQWWGNEILGCVLNTHRAFARAIIALRDQPPSVPQGWRLVPLEPDAMILRPFYLCPPDELRLAWDSMLRVAEGKQGRQEFATPSAPSSSQQGEADAAPVPLMAEPMRSVWIEGKEQEAFEAWVAEQLAPARYNHPFMVKTASGTYSHPWMADRWEAWSERAKRASLESAKSGEVGK